MNQHWEYEDSIYRFYHQSFKVYNVQQLTQDIVKVLRKLSPNQDEHLDGYFENLISEGATSLEWQRSHNKEWEKTTRPMLEVFFHSKFFLEMAIKYGKLYDQAPTLLDSGWAA